MNVLWLFITSLFYLAMEDSKVSGFGSLTADDLDFARSALVDVAKDITLKRTRTIPIASGGMSRLKYVKKTRDGGSGSRKWKIRRFYKKGGRKSFKVITEKVPTNKPRSYNKFNEVVDQVERAMAQAQLSRKPINLPDLKKVISNAINRGNVRFARRGVGIGMFTASKAVKSSKSGRGKRSAANAAKKFLADIKKDLGDDKFSDLLALQGEVTLMYAVDITGSMSQEIGAAKAIVTEISREDRSEPVDFILSTFGDPISQGSIIYKSDDKVDSFIAEVGKLKATGGGDCAEFAFEGMITALYEDPRWGSPLYVFTDAPPKDATEENKETLSVLAEDLGVTINFFAGKACTQTPYKFENFNEVAEQNSGQLLQLKETELKSMAGFTGSALGGSTTVASGTNKVARKRRSITNQIAVPVDDTVSKLIVTVTTSNSPRGIALVTPYGRPTSKGKTIHSKVIVFIIESPSKGIWKLLVPSSVGKYEYSAKVSSPENLDFEHYYTRKERKKLVHVRNPLAGEYANVNLTVSGIRHIQPNFLSVDVIDISGKVLISNNKLKSIGRSGLRFSFSFSPPSKTFKLMLKGKTKSNKNFQRISRHVDRAKPLVLKEFYNSGHYTIKQGGNAFIILYLFNGSNKKESFTVAFKDTLGCKISLPGRQRLLAKPKSKKFLRVRVLCKGKKGEVGKTESVIIIVKSNGVITTEVVPLMII